MGRKRSIVTDTLGLVLAVLVTAANVQDSVAGTHLLDQVAADHPTIRKVWVDGGYRQHFVEHAATLGIDMEISQRAPGTRGFAPIPKRWAVERTYGWIMLHRRLTRDYETLPARSEAVIHLAMTDLLARSDITGSNANSGMKQREKTTSKPMCINVAPLSRPCWRSLLLGSSRRPSGSGALWRPPVSPVWSTSSRLSGSARTSG